MKMKLQMDGQFPVLPDAPVEGSEGAGVLQLMIREFMTHHYRLACGKESATPWCSMARHQSSLWDSNMWPSEVMVKDPSKIVLGDCRKIVGLWRQCQTQMGASETFRFNFYIDSEGLQSSMYLIVSLPGHGPVMSVEERTSTLGRGPVVCPPIIPSGICNPGDTGLIVLIAEHAMGVVKGASRFMSTLSLCQCHPNRQVSPFRR